MTQNELNIIPLTSDLPQRILKFCHEERPFSPRTLRSFSHSSHSRLRKFFEAPQIFRRFLSSSYLRQSTFDSFDNFANFEKASITLLLIPELSLRGKVSNNLIAVIAFELWESCSYLLSQLALKDIPKQAVCVSWGYRLFTHDKSYMNCFNSAAAFVTGKDSSRLYSRRLVF